MRHRKSKLICKCGTEGGVLTLRKAGNSKTKNALYIQHYDPTRKAGKRPCYISRQNIALIKLNDKRYHKEYKPLIEEYAKRLEDGWPASNNEIDAIEERAVRLLIDLKWPVRVVSINDKLFADKTEAQVLGFVKGFEDKFRIKVTREQAFKTLSRGRPRFRMTQNEQKGWKEVIKSGRRIPYVPSNNDS